eukprot:scaffold4500_cov111-Skeletonema_dohrnii-CCMP3373.AAC.3
MPKAKKRAPGEFAPTQFATCIENGLNIHAQAKSAASSKSEKKKKEASKSKKGNKHIVENPAAKETAAKRKLNQKHPRIECTNGAMEALQICHSEFIKATSTALVALESSKNKKAEAAAATSSKKKVSFSSTTKTVTYNEDHVVECMKQMGFSNLVERAMKSINTGSSKQQHTNKVKQQKQQLKQPSKPPPSQNKKRKRKSNPLDDAALLAEQERLLSESARRVYQNHNQQQQQQQQQEIQSQQQQADESQAVTATPKDSGSSGDASGALV